VIDLDAVLLGKASRFFGNFTSGADHSLARITTAKVFPDNIELGFELPRASGRLAEIRYSIGMPQREPGFKPREADRRVGLYDSDYTDRARHDGESQAVRYANRWRIEKADPSLRLSPPKRPIVYHIEHTNPTRYRRWVRDGILAWNKAFEKVGIVDAIVVLQQDARSGAYMESDPEDIRWSFVRWTNSEMGFAIGPVAFVAHARARFLDQAIDDGESWQKARRLFGMLLGKQMGAIAEASHWIGGAHITRFFKGDLEGADPVTPVPVAEQRRALKFIVEHAFCDEAFALEPAMLRKLGSDNWYDAGSGDDHDWAIHNSLLGVQASALSLLINPIRLRRVKDNERRIERGEDALTVPEVWAVVRAAIWAPLTDEGEGFSNRQPFISSIERNCQGEHVDRLIDLTTGMYWPGASAHDLRASARQELRAIDAALPQALARPGLDSYSLAHFQDVQERIRRALEASDLRKG
jgi:hypothetical protein